VRAVASGLYLESMRLVPCNPMCSPTGQAHLVFGGGGVFHVPQQYTLVVCTMGDGGEPGKGGGQRAEFGIHAPSALTTPCAHLQVKRTSRSAVEVCFMYLSNIYCSVYHWGWRRAG
jgi:hypothetical protein